MLQLWVIPIYSSMLNPKNHAKRLSLIMNKAAKFKFPRISDDQAEGCHILSPSHLGKWIPLPAVISVSYNKYLVHNVTQSEMQNSSQGSLQGCAGAILPPGPWRVLLSPVFLLFQMYDLGLYRTGFKVISRAAENEKKWTETMFCSYCKHNLAT